MSSGKLYAVILVVIAVSGFIVFYNAYNAFTDTSQEYMNLCGQEYMFPIRLSNMTYKGYVYFNDSGKITYFNVTLVLKPVPTCTSPELAYGITLIAENKESGERFYADPIAIWPATELVKPIPSDVLKQRDTVSYTAIVNGMPLPYTIEYNGEALVSTIGGAWSGLNYTISNATRGLLISYTQGDFINDASVVYDSETGIPVLVHSVREWSNGDNMVVHLELEKVDEPLQLRLNSLIFSSIASGLALAYAVKEILA